MAALEHRPDHDGELAAAFLGIALVIAGAGLDRRGVVHRAAVAANRATGPT